MEFILFIDFLMEYVLNWKVRPFLLEFASLFLSEGWLVNGFLFSCLRKFAKHIQSFGVFLFLIFKTEPIAIRETLFFLKSLFAQLTHAIGY